MLGFDPISTFPISAIAPLPVAAVTGGAPNYQYPGEASINPEAINALFDTTGREDAQRRRLDATRRALGLLPDPVAPVESPAPQEPVAEPFDDALYAGVLADEQRRQDAAKAADAVIQQLRTQMALAAAAEERIRRDDGDVLMLLAEVL